MKVMSAIIILIVIVIVILGVVLSGLTLVENFAGENDAFLPPDISADIQANTIVEELNKAANPVPPAQEAQVARDTAAEEAEEQRLKDIENAKIIEARDKYRRERAPVSEYVLFLEQREDNRKATEANQTGDPSPIVQLSGFLEDMNNMNTWAISHPNEMLK
jgi:cytoskeletal protein RodZ